VSDPKLNIDSTPRQRHWLVKFGVWFTGHARPVAYPSGAKHPTPHHTSGAVGGVWIPAAPGRRKAKILKLPPLPGRDDSQRVHSFPSNKLILRLFVGGSVIIL